jgi:hypothetical protein
MPTFSRLRIRLLAMAQTANGFGWSPYGRSAIAGDFINVTGVGPTIAAPPGLFADARPVERGLVSKGLS